VIASVFYYFYVILMTCIMLNMIIAMLLDGYVTVKESGQSTSNEILRYNVGSLWKDETDAARLQPNGALL